MEKVEVNSERWLKLADFEDEKWAVIEEHQFYAISNYGRLKRLAHVYYPPIESRYVHQRTLSERICKLYKNRCGYMCFRVTRDGKLVQLYIHQQVAKYFVDNPSKYKVVNHKNENKSDNVYTNLEWCTDKYNSNYGTCQQRRAISIRKMRRRREISIDQYTMDGEYIRHYSTKGELDDAGFLEKTIMRVCRRSMESSQGYVWRFGGDIFTKPVRIDSKGGTIRKKVLCYDLNGCFVTQYDNLLEAALAIGGRHKRNGICNCIYGKVRQAYGYIWKYANE